MHYFFAIFVFFYIKKIRHLKDSDVHKYSVPQKKNKYFEKIEQDILTQAVPSVH